MELINAEIVMLPPEEGGRTKPFNVNGYPTRYRPHIVLQPRETRFAKIEIRDGQRQIAEEYLGICFWNGPSHIPVSMPFTATLLLQYHPNVSYARVIPGVEFTIREGAHFVGHGKVLKRWTEMSEERNFG